MEYIIGIDEVGRGCLAGPVMVAAAAVPRGLKIRNHKLGKLRDSKKLTAKQREEWFKWIQSQMSKSKDQLFVAKASVYPKTIDRINISQAANLAATRSVLKLISNFKLPISKLKIYLDGGLYLPKNQNPKFYILNSRTIVRGDEKYACIKLASIVAKVSRDRLLGRYHKKYPRYDFDRHKGYGTKIHLAAIRKYGRCPIHRLTFIEKFTKLD